MKKVIKGWVLIPNVRYTNDGGIGFVEEQPNMQAMATTNRLVYPAEIIYETNDD